MNRRNFLQTALRAGLGGLIRRPISISIATVLDSPAKDRDHFFTLFEKEFDMSYSIVTYLFGPK